MTAASSRFRMTTRTRVSSWATVVAAILTVGLAALPAVASRGLIQDLLFIFTMLCLAQYWNLLAGYAGLVSVGQQAFVGLGAYTLFASTILAGIEPLTAVLLSGVIAATMAVPTAFVVFRLRGAYFAIGTWVVAEVYRLVLAQVKELGGGTGTSLTMSVVSSTAGLDWVSTAFDVRTPAARDIIVYWAALVLLVITLAGIYWLLRSRFGLALSALRDSELTASSVGVDAFHLKVFVYILTAAGGGAAGALIFLQSARISPDSAFAVLDWTAYVIFIVVIGGIGTIEGPIVGAVVFYFLQTYLAAFGTWYLMLLGALGIVIMLIAPKGIWGSIADRFDLHLFPTRRRLVVTSTRRTGDDRQRARQSGPPSGQMRR
jgi:branched-chain amino acid transport system permease protein